MKWLYPLLIVFLLVLTGQSQTNVISVNVGDYGLVPKATMVTLTLISPNPRTYNNILISQVPISITTSSNGVGYFTNIIWGQYRADINANPVTKFLFVVNTNSTGSISLASLVSNPQALPPNPATNYYTQAQIDSLLYGVTSGALTNAYATNAAGVIVTNRLAFISTNYAAAGVTNLTAGQLSTIAAALTNASAFDTNGAATAVSSAIISSNYVTASITNGLATTNYVNTATNGFVTASVTNGLATTSYVNTATNGFVTASVTNGLATTNFVNTSIANATNFSSIIITNDINRGTNGVSGATTPGVGLALSISSGGSSGISPGTGGAGGTVNISSGQTGSGTLGTGGAGGTVNLASGGVGIFAGGAGGTVNIANGNANGAGGTVNIATNNGTTYVGNLTSFGNFTENGFSTFKTNAYFAGDIYVTNHAYDVSTSQLDPLANEYVTATFVRSVLNNGAFLYGTTNTIAVGFSNILTASTNTVSLQFGANAPSGYTKGFTNFVTGTYPNGPYFASIVSTNTYQSVTGPFVNDFYIQADGSGANHALGIAPDIFVTYDLTNLIPICAGAEQSLTMAATTNLYTWIQSAAQYNSTNAAGFYVVRRVRVTSQNGTALYINVKGGSGTATTLAFSTPVTINANYSGTFTGNGSGLTNIAATGIIGTAVTNNASPTLTGLSVGAQTALDVNGNGKFGGVGLTNGVLTGNGSGITNVSTSLPSATASLTITNLTVGAPIIYTGGTPTITTNAATLLSAVSLDANANNSRMLISITTSSATQSAFSNYFTINLSGTPLSTNNVYPIFSLFSTNTSIIQGAPRPLVVTSNSIIWGSASSVPSVNTTYQYMLQVLR